MTLGIFGGAVYLSVQYLNAPAVGTVTVQPAAKPQPTADKTHRDEYASFTYNGQFTERDADQTNGSALATYWFTRNQMTGGELSIQIHDLNGKQIQADSSYNLRATKTDQYSQSRFKTADGKDVVIFADSNGPYNKTAFIQEGTRYAVISLRGNGANNDPGLVATMTGVLTSWQWL